MCVRGPAAGSPRACAGVPPGMARGRCEGGMVESGNRGCGRRITHPLRAPGAAIVILNSITRRLPKQPLPMSGRYLRISVSSVNLTRLGLRPSSLSELTLHTAEETGLTSPQAPGRWLWRAMRLPVSLLLRLNPDPPSLSYAVFFDLSRTFEGPRTKRSTEGAASPMRSK